MIELHPSGAETEGGVSASFDLGPTDRMLRLVLDVSALVGALSILVESAPSNTGPWRACGETTDQPRSSTVAFDRWVRLRWIGEAADESTPFSATFAVQATADRSYANLDDLYTHGRPESGLSGLSITVRAEALATASTKADGKLGLRFDLPLVAWESDLAEAIAKIAAYDLLSIIGFNPDGADENIRTRHNDAWKWLSEVADSTVNPVGLVDSTPAVEDDGVVVVTRPSRGW